MPISLFSVNFGNCFVLGCSCCLFLSFLFFSFSLFFSFLFFLCLFICLFVCLFVCFFVSLFLCLLNLPRLELPLRLGHVVEDDNFDRAREFS